MTDDLSQNDYARRKMYKEQIEEARAQGKRWRFTNGNLIVNDRLVPLNLPSVRRDHQQIMCSSNDVSPEDAVAKNSAHPPPDTRVQTQLYSQQGHAQRNHTGAKQSDLKQMFRLDSLPCHQQPATVLLPTSPQMHQHVATDAAIGPAPQFSRQQPATQLSSSSPQSHQHAAIGPASQLTGHSPATQLPSTSSQINTCVDKNPPSKPQLSQPAQMSSQSSSRLGPLHHATVTQS